MERREFLRGVAAGMLGGTALYLGACGAAAPPAAEPQAPAAPGGEAPAGSGETAQAPAAQTAGENIQWQMTTSWPESLDTIHGGAIEVAARVEAMTGGKFKIKVNQAGEIVGGLEVMDAVQSNTVQTGHTATYYYVGKNETFGFATALPFGLNAQQQNAWLYHGGGMELLDPLFAEFGIKAFPAGNTTAQMGGWYKREVNTLADMKGLKFRIPGLGGRVMERIGVVTQTLPGGEIFLALQTGAIDAAEWIGPYDDKKLGLNEAADFYYYPGWWEPGPTLDCYVNLDEWNKLSPTYQEIFKTACYQANMDMIAKYDARNQAALNEMISTGTQLKPYPQEILTGAQKAAFELYDELASKDAKFFAPTYTAWKQFREDIYAWHQINEQSFSLFVTNNPIG